jgi:signal recognition particle receptor subunit beta
MAHLNVRERLIETRIAYVGTQLAGKTTNLECVSRDPTRGRASTLEIADQLLSFDWRPSRRALDCEMAVKVVAAKGAVSTERLDDVLAGADGVVVVLDATPSAEADNRRTLELVRDAFTRIAPLPVVVQVNKIDLADARAVRDVVGEIEWPLFPAAAVRGEGVFETIEAALEAVVEGMKLKRPVALGEPKIDQNPLLTALREILRETVAECMARIEKETADRVSQKVAEAIKQTVGPRFEKLESAGAELRTGNTELKTVLTKSAEESRRAVTGLERSLTSLERSLAELSRNVTELQTGTLDLVSHSDLASTEGRLFSSLSVLAKSLESAARTVESTATLVPKIPARIGAFETSLHTLHTDTSEALDRVTGLVSKVQEDLHELLDELKKPKKGWFG